MMPTSERWALLAAFLFYFVMVFVWPTWRVYRATGKNPYVLPKGDDVYGFVSRWFKYVLVLLVLYLITQAVWPTTDKAAGAIAWLATPSARIAGWVLLSVSAVWLAVAQLHMGASWRIGIDTKNKTDLVTQGLFAYSRNPIFLAMRVNLLALFLLQPNALTLTLFAAGDVLMQVQARLEEAHLQRLHGDRYVAYCNRVRRWL